MRILPENVSYNHFLFHPIQTFPGHCGGLSLYIGPLQQRKTPGHRETHISLWIIVRVISLHLIDCRILALINGDLISNNIGSTHSGTQHMKFPRTFASATMLGPRSGRTSPFAHEPNMTSSSRLVAASSPASWMQSGSGTKWLKWYRDVSGASGKDVGSPRR